MDNNSFEILVPMNIDTDHTNKHKAPFKRVRVVGKSTAYLTTNKNNHIKIKEPVKGGVRFTTSYINTVKK